MTESWYVWYNEHTNEGEYRFCFWTEIQHISRTSVRKVKSCHEADTLLKEWMKAVCVEENQHGYPYCKTHECGACDVCGEPDCPHCNGVM